MRRLITALLALAIAVCIFLPSARYTEDEDSVLLARTIYALGKNESYQTKLKLGSVVMNRLENDWFPDDLGEVLEDPQQFPAGSRYDADSLRAAHELISGKRALERRISRFQRGQLQLLLRGRQRLKLVDIQNGRISEKEILRPLTK